MSYYIWIGAGLLLALVCLALYVLRTRPSHTAVPPVKDEMQLEAEREDALVTRWINGLLDGTRSLNDCRTTLSPREWSLAEARVDRHLREGGYAVRLLHKPWEDGADELEMRLQKYVQYRYFLASLRQATAADYQVWLDGFRARGGQPTHHYPYSIMDFYFLTRDCTTHLMRNASGRSICLIVPSGISFNCSETAPMPHIYSMDGFTNTSTFVPTYTDAK